MNPIQAIDQVARQVAYDLLHDAIGDAWESYPDIGEHDWQAVVEAASTLVEPPQLSNYHDAYQLLANRAELTS